MFAGCEDRCVSRTIPDPGFPDDDGSADPAVTAALTAFDTGTGEYVAALAAVQASRLLVPVVAVLGEVEVDDDGLAHDKTSDMAAVLMARPDGRRGLLAFTSAQALAAWDPGARPVPVSTATAAQAALQQQADAMVIDVAGPVRFVVQGEDLQGLAARWHLTRVGERSAWIRPSPE